VFTVYFRNSTTTPSQPGLRSLVDAALRECAATWTGEEAELALPDGSLFCLFGEDEEEGMLLEYPVLTDAVAGAIYAIADRAMVFILDDLLEPTAVRTAGSVGEVRAADMSIRGYLTVDGPAALHHQLEQFPESAPRVEGKRGMGPTRISGSPFEDKPLLGRLAGLLFGTKK
jgi:hypothetical protein